MSMYDIMMGDGKQQERGQVLCYTLLNIPQGDLPRFRDAWLEIDTDGTLQIGVYSRVGGNNRPDYIESIERLEAHPLYRRTDNDEFDTTYTTFRFAYPPAVPQHLKESAARGETNGWDKMDDAAWMELAEQARVNAPYKEPRDMSAAWKAAQAKIETEGMTERQAELSKPMMERLQQAFDPNKPASDSPTIIEI